MISPNVPVWTVLGAGTASPHPSLSPSGHLLTLPDKTRILIDLGAGTLWRLARAGVAWQDLQALFVSHRHLDHTLDLQALMFAARIPGHGRTLPLPIHMGPGMMQVVEALRGAWGDWMTPRGFEARWTEHQDGDEVQLGELRVLLRTVEHDATSVGMRFVWRGRRIAYSGDSAYSSSLVDLCRDAELAVLECSTDDDQPVPGHLSPETLARVAIEARVKHVVVVHRYPSLDGVDVASRIAAHGYTGTLSVAQDGDAYALPEPPEP